LAAATLAVSETNDVGMSTPALGDEHEMTVTEAGVADADVVDTETAPTEQPPTATPDEAEAEIVEPADIAKPEGVVEVRSPHGHLTLRPDQSVSDLDSDQQAGLLAIGIDVAKDPGVWPHLRAFIHMCQLRRLDPFAKEAYLIGRGSGTYRKWTMQTGIDGYRKMSASTGRFIRVKARLWTGPDDDDNSWRMVEEDGVMVMKRVWFDQWPESRGFPGSAMAIIEHYDEQGNITTTPATADWKFYAPFNPKYTGYGDNRRKVVDASGQPVMELSEMWEKGYSHMLVKCAEALAHRMAFPNTVNGFYVREEMHRAEEVARARDEEAARAKAQRTISEARQRAEITSEASTSPATMPAPARAGQMVTVGESARAVVDNLRADARVPRGQSRARTSASSGEASAPIDDRLAYLRAEISMLAELFGMTREKLLARQVAAAGKPLEQFTVDELFTAVKPMRAPAAARLRDSGRGAEAAAYETAPADAIMPLDRLLGRVEVDPAQPHLYVDNAGVCRDCEGFEDERIHEV
jgi:hypothetical protein